MTHTKDTPKCPNCGDGTIPSGDTWKLTPEAERYYKDHPEDKPRVNFSGCPVCGREEIQEMERAINEGFAESERDLKNKKTPLDTPKETWEEEFDNNRIFQDACEDRDASYIKSFIRSLLEKERKEAVREVIEKIEFEIGNYEKIPEWQEIKRMFAGDKQEVIIHFLEWYNKKQLELLATLREEKEGSE